MLPAFLAALNRGFNKNCKIPSPRPPLDSVHNIKAYMIYKPNVTTAEYNSCVCTVADVNSSFIASSFLILCVKEYDESEAGEQCSIQSILVSE